MRFLVSLYLFLWVQQSLYWVVFCRVYQWIEMVINLCIIHCWKVIDNCSLFLQMWVDFWHYYLSLNFELQLSWFDRIYSRWFGVLGSGAHMVLIVINFNMMIRHKSELFQVDKDDVRFINTWLIMIHYKSDEVPLSRRLYNFITSHEAWVNIKSYFSTLRAEFYM